MPASDPLPSPASLPAQGLVLVKATTLRALVAAAAAEIAGVQGEITVKKDRATGKTTIGLAAGAGGGAAKSVWFLEGGVAVQYTIRATLVV